MTIVIGYAHPDTTIAVLTADTQITTSIREDNRPIGKHFERKLWIADDSMYAFGSIGLMDEASRKLINEMKSGSIDIEKIVSEGKFPQLRDLNHSRMGTKLPNFNNGCILSSFLLVTRYNNKPSLYTCWPLGDVDSRILTHVGSGSNRVERYIQSLNTLADARDYLSGDTRMTNEEAIQVSLEAARYAQQEDIYSSGLDMVVLTPKRIVDHHKDLQEDNFMKKLRKIEARHRSKKRAKK